MDREFILQQARSYIEQAINGLEIENQKLDFKKVWYNLTDIKGINEFLKDTSAIANTFGPDGLIIIGYDEKSKEYANASFKNSGLNDTSLIIDLINSKVDRLFYINIIEAKINETNISIIHIPPSIDKPHVIKNYQTIDKGGKIKQEQNRVFIRRGTQTFPASKSDFELMYYDRKNIIPEFKILSSLHYSGISLFVTYNNHTVPFVEDQPFFIHANDLPITLENVGLRPVSISRLSLKLFIFEDAHESEIIKLESAFNYIANPIIIQPGNIKSFTMSFSIKSLINVQYNYILSKIEEINNNKKNLLTNSILLTLSTGKQITSELTISKS